MGAVDLRVGRGPAAEAHIRPRLQPREHLPVRARLCTRTDDRQHLVSICARPKAKPKKRGKKRRRRRSRRRKKEKEKMITNTDINKSNAKTIQKLKFKIQKMLCFALPAVFFCFVWFVFFFPFFIFFSFFFGPPCMQKQPSSLGAPRASRRRRCMPPSEAR